jgi:hypothetical protein
MPVTASKFPQDVRRALLVGLPSPGDMLDFGTLPSHQPSAVSRQPKPKSRIPNSS